MMNNSKLEEIAERLTEIDRQEMATICRPSEATTYTAEDLTDVEKMQYIIDWLLDFID